jgi:hypothetical protein
VKHPIGRRLLNTIMRFWVAEWLRLRVFVVKEVNVIE